MEFTNTVTESLSWFWIVETRLTIRSRRRSKIRRQFVSWKRERARKLTENDREDREDEELRQDEEEEESLEDDSLQDRSVVSSLIFPKSSKGDREENGEDSGENGREDT